MRLQITKRVLLSTLLYTVTLLYSWESYGQFDELHDTGAPFFNINDSDSSHGDSNNNDSDYDHSTLSPAEEIATTDHATSTLDEINNSLPTVNLDSVNAAVRDSILPIEDMQSNDLPRTDHSDGDDHRALPNSHSNDHQIDDSVEKITARFIDDKLLLSDGQTDHVCPIKDLSSFLNLQQLEQECR